MEYEIVNLEEKTVAGVQARTSNLSPEMGSVIGGLWKSFYEDGIYASIPEKCNQKVLGIYMNYAGDEADEYTAAVACETKKHATVTEEAVKWTIPAGRYARFVVTGNMHTSVAKFWEELWRMELPRAFVCDFEEYQNADMEHAEIHMYIGLK